MQSTNNGTIQNEVIAQGGYPGQGSGQEYPTPMSGGFPNDYGLQRDYRSGYPHHPEYYHPWIKDPRFEYPGFPNSGVSSTENVRDLQVVVDQLTQALEQQTKRVGVLEFAVNALISQGSLGCMNKTGEYLPLALACQSEGMPAASTIRKWIASGTLTEWKQGSGLDESDCHYKRLGGKGRIYLNVSKVMADMSTFKGK